MVGTEGAVVMWGGCSLGQAQHSYDQVVDDLRSAYDRMALERERTDAALWKVAERDRFHALLVKEQKANLLEIGAGTGKDGKFFEDSGLHVVCTDISPENIKLCRQKGLAAHVMDLLHLDFPDATFDAAYAMNCLLHVPSGDLAKALKAIQNVLRSGGVFYLGQYGGREYEGLSDRDGYDPPRFYSYHSDDEIQKVVSEFFKVISFEQIAIDDADAERDHFQALILRRL